MTRPGLMYLTRLGAAGALLGAQGCSNPLAPRASDYGQRAPESRLRSIDRFTPEPYAKPAPEPPPPGQEHTVPGSEPYPDRFAAMQTLSMSLDEARAATLANNLDLKVALVDPTIAAQALREEEGKFDAVFRPSVRYRVDDQPTLNTTASNQDNVLSAGAGLDLPLRSGGRLSVDLSESKADTQNPFVTLPTAYTSGLTFSISQPLLRNAGREVNTHSIRIASYQEQITQSRTKLEVIRQLAAVDRSYWRLYAARRELDVRLGQYELARQQLDRAKRRVAAGRVADVEIIRAEAGLTERLGAIIIAENAVLLQQRELKRIVNIPGLTMETRVMLTTGTEPAPVQYGFAGPELADAGVANRMEMLELELQLAADASTIDFNRNQALPLLTLDYSYNIGGLGDSFHKSHAVLATNDFDSWSIGLSGSVPIGNQSAKARVQSAILTRLQRLSTREARRLAIRQEVLNAVDSVDSGWQQIMAARLASIAAGRTLDAEQRQFDVGARTSTDVLDAATRLADAQSSEIRALADYQIGLVDLAFATGTLLGKTKVDWAPLDPSAAPLAPPQAPGPSPLPER